ncbi:uncharacterized protein LOC144078953 isoform X6 [Stigmatopora argus]
MDGQRDQADFWSGTDGRHGRTDGMDQRTARTARTDGRHGQADGMDGRTAWTGGRHGRADGRQGRTEGSRSDGAAHVHPRQLRIWSLSGGGAIYPSQQIANEPAMSPRTSRDHRDLLGW